MCARLRCIKSFANLFLMTHIVFCCFFLILISRKVVTDVIWEVSRHGSDKGGELLWKWMNRKLVTTCWPTWLALATSATNHSTSCCHQPKGCFPSAESCPFYCRASLKGTLFQQHKPCKANVKGDNSHLLMLIKSLRCRIDFIINGRQEHLLTGVDHRPDSAIIDRRHH